MFYQLKPGYLLVQYNMEYTVMQRMFQKVMTH